MNKFTVPYDFMLIKLLFLPNFQGQKEQRKAYLNAKDVNKDCAKRFDKTTI